MSGVSRCRSGSPYEARYGFCRARRVGARVLIAGTAPIPPPGEPLATTAYAQTRRCGEVIAAALAELGATLEDVVRTRMFITDPAEADEVGRAHCDIFGAAEPVATMVVTRLLDPAWKVEMECEASVAVGGAGDDAALERTRRELLTALREGWQEASAAGLCGEGAFEAALGAARRLPLGRDRGD